MNEATTAGEFWFTASYTDTVTLCAVWSTDSDSGEACWATARASTEDPMFGLDEAWGRPDEVQALAIELVYLACSRAPYVPGVLDPYYWDNGDVYILGQQTPVRCLPYPGGPGLIDCSFVPYVPGWLEADDYVYVLGEQTPVQCWNNPGPIDWPRQPDDVGVIYRL